MPIWRLRIHSPLPFATTSQSKDIAALFLSPRGYLQGVDGAVPDTPGATRLSGRCYLEKKEPKNCLNDSSYYLDLTLKMEECPSTCWYIALQSQKGCCCFSLTSLGFRSSKNRFARKNWISGFSFSQFSGWRTLTHLHQLQIPCYQLLQQQLFHPTFPSPSKKKTKSLSSPSDQLQM